MSNGWGSFRSGTDGKVHVCPVADDGKSVQPPHILREDCPCGPEPDWDDDQVIVHNTAH